MNFRATEHNPNPNPNPEELSSLGAKVPASPASTKHTFHDSRKDQIERERTGWVINKPTEDGNYSGRSSSNSSRQTRMASQSGPVYPIWCELNEVNVIIIVAITRCWAIFVTRSRQQLSYRPIPATRCRDRLRERPVSCFTVHCSESSFRQCFSFEKDEQQDLWYFVINISLLYKFCDIQIYKKISFLSIRRI